MKKIWTNLVDHELKNDLPSFHFWNGIDVWIERPHLVNRKLLSTEVLHTVNTHNFKDKASVFSNKEITELSLNDIFPGEACLKCLNLDSSCEKSANDSCKNKHASIIFRKLIPRNSVKFCCVLEAVIKNETDNVVSFWPKRSDVINSAITPNFPYQIKLNDNRIVIETYGDDSDVNPKAEASKDWLKSCVLPKVIKWCCYTPTTTVLPSLNLISAKCYSQNYNYLKEKCAKKYIEMWPECSDPLKYVYEDIGIAAYLMTLWEKERTDLNLTSKQTFVDLGCGNGLLVDILTSEGYAGIGIDVRRRKIWDLYDAQTSLIEKTIEPSDHHIFPDHNWIIGNHSDELTPWIPVIAARSSYKMRVFLLPCCAYTFNGKYERFCQGKTQYQSYLSFIRKLCESMGFVVQEDKLRIPSTKRICFVCASRSYNKEDDKYIDSLREEFIKDNSRKADKIPLKLPHLKPMNETTKELASCIETETETKKTNWINDFKPRERVEIVQNCSQLDRKFLNDTVLMVAKILLKTENYISLQRGQETISWNAGGKIKLCNLITSLDPSVLKSMKNQCGGFQTFLRNHRNVFHIIDGDVQLTLPLKDVPLNSKQVRKRKNNRGRQYCFKQKPCFFYFHHPQGCPLEDSDCCFSHQPTEL